MVGSSTSASIDIKLDLGAKPFNPVVDESAPKSLLEDTILNLSDSVEASKARHPIVDSSLDSSQHHRVADNSTSDNNPEVSRA